MAVNLQDALTLFRRLGVYPEMLSQSEFSAAYFRLARRYHPDLSPNTAELMANINAARETILQSYLSDLNRKNTRRNPRPTDPPEYERGATFADASSFNR